MSADDQAYAEPFRRIQPEEARSLIDGGQVTVVDVREPWEYEKDHIAGAKLILKSPGLAPTDARIAAPLARAADTGVLVQGELELFVRALADLKDERGYAPKLLASTGTNGKTTTTALTALLVERAGRSAVAAGNISPTMLDAPTAVEIVRGTTTAIGAKR